MKKSGELMGCMKMDGQIIDKTSTWGNYVKRK